MTTPTEKSSHAEQVVSEPERTKPCCKRLVSTDPESPKGWCVEIDGHDGECVPAPPRSYDPPVPSEFLRRYDDVYQRDVALKWDDETKSGLYSGRWLVKWKLQT